MAVEFGILGSLRVVDAGGAREIPAGKQRALLAALLLRANSVVSIDLLVDTLWPKGSSEGARSTLHSHVLRLRRTLGDEVGARVRTSGAGYVIDIGAGELDADRVAVLLEASRAAAAAGDWAQAGGHGRAALDLWRGEPLAGVAAEGWLADEADRLGELRNLAVETWVEAELRCGRPDQVIAELRALIAANPLNERGHAHLMLALHAAGRTAQALQVYQQIRTLLLEELGIEPGAHLRRAHEVVLSGEAAQIGAGAPAGGSAQDGARFQLPADTRLFTGRAQELRAVADAAGAALLGGGAVAISAIDGMAGVGKTALAIHAAHRVRAQFPDGQLFLNLRGFTAGLEPMPAAEALERLLVSLGVSAQALPKDLDELAALLRTRLSGNRVLIVLDNAVSGDQVRPLLPGSEGCLVIVTSRIRLAGLDDAYCLTLETLPLDDAIALLVQAAGPGRIQTDPAAQGPLTDQAQLTELIGLCGHLPLAVRIVAARLRRRPALQISDMVGQLRDERERLSYLQDRDRDITAVFDSSYSALTDDEQRILRLLGLIPGPDFDIRAVASLAGVSRREAERLLESLAEHHLVVERSAGRYGFHDLVRLYARSRSADEPEQDREAALRRLFAWYLNTADGAARVLRPQRRHALAEPAVPGPLCLAFDSPSSAQGWLAAEYVNILAAQRMAAEHGHHEAAARFPRALFEVFTGQGRWTDMADAFTLATKAVKQLGDQHLEAGLNLDLASAVARTRGPDEAIRHFETAAAMFASIEDRTGEAAVYINLGQFHFSAHRFAQARTNYHHALALQRQIGNVVGEAAALDGLAKVSSESGDHDTALDLLLLARELYRQAEDRFGEAMTAANLGHLLARADRHHEAVAELRTAVELCQRIDHRMAEAACWESLGEPLQVLGDRQGAIDALTRAHALFSGNEENSARRVQSLLDRLAVTGVGT